MAKHTTVCPFYLTILPVGKSSNGMSVRPAEAEVQRQRRAQKIFGTIATYHLEGAISAAYPMQTFRCSWRIGKFQRKEFHSSGKRAQHGENFACSGNVSARHLQHVDAELLEGPLPDETGRLPRRGKSFCFLAFGTCFDKSSNLRTQLAGRKSPTTVL